MAEGFRLIAAADRGWAIGRNGRMLVQIPKERQLFLAETRGAAVVMGRKTFDALPGRQPLYDRENIVLSRDPGFAPRGVRVFRSFEEALAFLQTLPPEKVFIIGGESIFRQFLPWCGTADITAVDYRYDGDSFLPALDRDPSWKLLHSRPGPGSFMEASCGKRRGDLFRSSFHFSEIYQDPCRPEPVRGN